MIFFLYSWTSSQKKGVNNYSTNTHRLYTPDRDNGLTKSNIILESLGDIFFING